jgi:diguanylate cyclase (GGDEF)-like protein
MNAVPSKLRLLLIDSARQLSDSLLREAQATGWAALEIQRADSARAAATRLAEASSDAVLLVLPAGSGDSHWADVSDAALNAAVVVLSPDPDFVLARRLLAIGVQDVVPLAEAGPVALARVLRLAVERKRIEQSARRTYATDLGTGLPSHTQLLEHMSQLFALREREPAPTALLVFRIEGLRALETELGPESAQVLRRKVAVRLRAGLRASDVVAALGVESYAVLLSALESAEHIQLVTDKLLAALRRPFTVTGRAVSVAVGIGTARYPDDGRLAEDLLRVAVSAAALNPAVGRASPARRGGPGGARAANDES